MPNDDGNELEQARLKLDRQRFELDKAKQLFEERKYSDQGDSRIEELSKLRAEREKAELESRDLSTPFYAKPTYVTALFQGVALVVAVISALISLGAWNALRQADQAKSDLENAKLKQADAEQKEKAALDAAGVADQNRKIAEGLRDQAKSAETAAEHQAVVVRLEPILASLNKKEYYPDKFLNDLNVDPYARDDKFPELRLLIAALHEGDTETQQKRAEFLEEYGLGTSSHAMGTRLAALDILLYVLADEDRGPTAKAVHSFRSRVEGEFVQLATSKRTGIVDGRVMKTLIQTFGRLRSSDAICSEYWRRSADHDLVLSLGAFIFSHFDDLDAVNANCVNAAWKWLSVDSDSWRFAHPEFYAEVFESNVIVSGLSGFPSVLTLSRNFSSGNPREIEDGEKILIDVGSGDAKKTAIWNPQETGIETSDAKFEGEDPPEFGGGHAIDKFKDWAAKNAGVLSLLNQPSMEKISQCRPEILRIFSRGHYIGQASIQKFCPAGILAAAPDSRK